MIPPPFRGPRRRRPARRQLALGVSLLAALSACKAPDLVRRDLMGDFEVAEHLADTDRIDFNNVSASVTDDRLRFFREKDGSFVLPPRDVEMRFQDFSGELTAIEIAGSSDVGSVSIPITLNGREIGIWTASGGTTRIAVPSGAVRPGENRLVFMAGSVRSVMLAEKNRVRIMQIGFERRTPASFGAGTYSYRGSNEKGWWQGADTRETVVYVPLPAERRWLRLRIGADAAGGAAGRLEWTPAGGEMLALFRFDLSPGGGKDLSIELPGAGFGQLKLVVEAGRAFWGSPRVCVKDVGAGVASSAAAPPPARPFNIIIYLVDTLRADAIETYGYGRPTTPYLKKLATESMVFTDVMGHAPWTKPSVASLMTGLHPNEHEVVEHDRFLHAKLTTLAERLTDHQRVIYSAHPVIGSSSGFAQGFDRTISEPNARADTVYESLRPVLKDLAAGGRPFFLYVHTIDTHYPYEAIAPFDRLVERTGSELEASADQTSRAFITAAKQRASELTPADVRYLRSLYDTEVARADFYFGKVVDELRSLGLFDNTLILFTADHGEEFREHGGFQHGHTLYQEQVRLPWMLKPPRGLGAAGPITARVRQIDFVPTVLDLLGKAVPADLPGASYASLFRGEGRMTLPLTVFAETRLDTRKVSATYERWRLIETRPANPASTESMLFDLVTDPGESRDVANAQPSIVGFLRQELRRWELSSERTRRLTSQDATQELSETDIETLKALGYVD